MISRFFRFLRCLAGGDEPRSHELCLVANIREHLLADVQLGEAGHGSEVLDEGDVALGCTGEVELVQVLEEVGVSQSGDLVH